MNRKRDRTRSEETKPAAKRGSGDGAEGPKRAGTRKRSAAPSSPESGGVEAPPTGQPAATGAAASGGKRPTRRAELNHALVLELRALRATLTRTTEAFDLRLGGVLAERLQRLEGEASVGQKPKLLTVKAAQAALDDLASLRVKPKRGRLKDLRRLERLVRRLSELVPGA